MIFDRLITAWLLRNETTKLGKLTNVFAIFLAMRFISSNDATDLNNVETRAQSLDELRNGQLFCYSTH